MKKKKKKTNKQKQNNTENCTDRESNRWSLAHQSCTLPPARSLFHEAVYDRTNT